VSSVHQGLLFFKRPRGARPSPLIGDGKGLFRTYEGGEEKISKMITALQLPPSLLLAGHVRLIQFHPTQSAFTTATAGPCLGDRRLACARNLTVLTVPHPDVVPRIPTPNDPKSDM